MLRGSKVCHNAAAAPDRADMHLFNIEQVRKGDQLTHDRQGLQWASCVGCALPFQDLHAFQHLALHRVIVQLCRSRTHLFT